LAPVAVKVAVCPEQIAAAEEFIVIIGNEFTFKLTVAELTQPTASVPVTVYTEEELGLTISKELVEPEFQEYVVAPPAVKVAVSPAQIAENEATAVTVGFELTVTLTVFVITHPLAFTPVNV
jgi:hypothetical protein